MCVGTSWQPVPCTKCRERACVGVNKKNIRKSVKAPVPYRRSGFTFSDVIGTTFLDFLVFFRAGGNTCAERSRSIVKTVLFCNFFGQAKKLKEFYTSHTIYQPKLRYPNLIITLIIIKPLIRLWNTPYPCSPVLSPHHYYKASLTYPQQGGH